MRKKINVYWWDEERSRVMKEELAYVKHDEAHFVDGNWNPAASCYLTAKQAKRFGRFNQSELARMERQKLESLCAPVLRQLENTASRFRKCFFDE